MKRTVTTIGFVLVVLSTGVLVLWHHGVLGPFAADRREVASAPGPEEREIAARIETQGGVVELDDQGRIVGVSLANTFATDTDLEVLASLGSLRKLDLSLTYVSDRGIEILKGLEALEELDLFAAEFITDAALSYLRGHPNLKRLNLRGTDATDISLQYVAELDALRSLDISFTQISDVGLESLSSLTQLEELIIGGNKITGVGFQALTLLPNLRTLDLKGIQRRDAGLCWAAAVGEPELDTIATLKSLEHLNLGWGLGLGAPRPTPDEDSEAQCRVEGGIRVTDSGLRKLATLAKLQSLELSGSEITSAGLAAALPAWNDLRELSLWNVQGIDDTIAGPLTKLERLEMLDLSRTPVTDRGLRELASSSSLRRLYVSRTNVTAAGLNAFREANRQCWISWSDEGGPRTAKTASE